VAGLEIVARRLVVAVFNRRLRGLLGAVVERIQRPDKILPLGEWEAGVKTLLAPGRAGLVDLEIQLIGDADKPVLVGRMQPATAEVENDAGRRRDGVGAPAHAV